MEKVTAALPKNDKETKEKFKDRPDKGEADFRKAREDMKGDVTKEKEKAGNAISTTTASEPSKEGVKLKEVEPMQDENPGALPKIPGAENAAPKPKTDQEISMEKEAKSLDQQMEENKISETQLQKSNEPAFNEALEQKNQAQEEARNAPEEYRAKEQPQLDKAKANAQNNVAGGLGQMFGARSGQFGKVQGSKTGTKTGDEAKRTEVANKLKEIYSRTKTNVETKLDTLENEVIKEFDKASKKAMDGFKNRVSYRLERYYDSIVNVVVEFLTGSLDPKINEIFIDEKNKFMNQMDSDVTTISNMVAKGLNEAKQMIKDGKKEVDDYWNGLEPELKKLAGDAKEKISGQFSQLEQSVNARHEKLVKTLSDKFVENVKKLKEEFDKIKSEKEGWLSVAFDAMAGVIKTILELKDMLMGIFAKAKESVIKIIEDPIQFFEKSDCRRQTRPR